LCTNEFVKIAGAVRIASLPVVLCAIAASARAAPGAGDYVPDAPKAFEGVGLTERLSSTIPLDLGFRDQDGHDVTLGDYFADELPVILTFNYSDCPMLCSLQLNGLATTLASLDLAPGREFRIVTIDLEPRESPARARETREKYITRLPPDRRADARRGWTFLVARTGADDAQIRAVAGAVGFHYKYIPAQAEYAHPAALILLSSRGMVTRYIGGVDYDAVVLHDSIERAGLAETSTNAGFVLTCFHYVASGNPHKAVVAMRIFAGAFLAAGLAVSWWWRRARRSRARSA
jgi:protein SCO1/2